MAVQRTKSHGLLRMRLQVHPLDTGVWGAAPGPLCLHAFWKKQIPLHGPSATKASFPIPGTQDPGDVAGGL